MSEFEGFCEFPGGSRAAIHCFAEFSAVSHARALSFVTPTRARTRVSWGLTQDRN